MIPLEVRHLDVEAGGLTVVSDLSFTLRSGEKMGVVGRNGAGKTSTLRVLAGEQPVAGGSVVRHGAMGYLRQDPRQHREHDDMPALRYVMEARDLVDLATRLEKARLALEEDPSDRRIASFAALEDRYRSEGGYRAEAEVRSIASGLGLAQDRLSLPVKALSGGERRRLELTRILFGGSDLLMLDEPTNHLDADAKTWLMKFLAGYGGALLVVSHDLGLLDASITRIMHLDRDGVVEYRGTYSQYREARARDEARLTTLAERQEQEIRRLRTLADSMRGQTQRRARTAKSMDTRREKLQAAKITAPTHERSIRVRFPEPPHCGATVLTVDGLAKSYGATDVFEDVSFDVGRGQRLLIMGLNGAGKTTLLRILTEQTEAGRRRRAIGTRRRARLLRPGTRGHHRWGRRARPICERRRRPTTSSSARCSACSACPARSRSRMPARCPAARRRSSPSRSSLRDARTCSCSTSRRTTSILRREPRSPRPCKGGRAR